MKNWRWVLPVLHCGILAAGVFSGWRLAEGHEALPRVERIRGWIEKLRPLHQKIRPPGPRDWLAQHREPGQTFEEYVKARGLAVLPETRRSLCLQPLGSFSAGQEKIIRLTAVYLEGYFGLPVKVAAPLPLDGVPEQARRKNPATGQLQYLTSHILQKILLPRLPRDAAVYIAFTAADLWPGADWNYVFGQASLDQRVGVWSLWRLGDPDAGAEDFRLCLLRTLKVASHETGHMFNLWHCILYQCNLNGSNSLDESDSQPPWLCPECLGKLLLATGAEPVARFRKLAAFCREQGFKEELEFFEKSIRALGQDPAGPAPEGGLPPGGAKRLAEE